ncbi:MAG: hypothetical protein V2I34_06170 [Bacteroidales bacterium]|jgi:hypothetical protein|nr:hypothetical protein [Bacteroidales bacterium]
MKRSGCKSVIRLLFVQVVLILSVAAYAADVDKQFSREFDASAIELLKINNRYGDVEIVNSDNNRIIIVVNVKLSHPNSSRAEKLLSMINVEFSENDNTAEARTVIDRQFSMDNRGPNHGFSIDYRVEMPADMDLDLSNRYGDLKAGILTGHVDIRVKYGSLFIKGLTRQNEEPLNRITGEYLRVGDIAEAGWLELNLRYVNRLNILSAQALLVNSRYSTNNNIDKVSSIVIDSKYDRFEINDLNNIVAESAYTAYKIGNISNKLDIETKYGSIEVENVEAGFELVKTDVAYSPVKIGFDNSASYSLKADTRYCGFSFNESKADIKQRIQESNSMYLEAVIGKGGTKSEVIIDADYGSVKLY